MKTLIVVPARMGSSRFPGKPLERLCGQSLVSRVGQIARAAAIALTNAEAVIATDDEGILDHVKGAGLNGVLTSADCPSGSDRALQAADRFAPNAEIIVNLQGDAPFTRPEDVVAVAEACAAQAVAPVATAYEQLSWDALDLLRAQKSHSPFSGTTVLVSNTGLAHWFSKSLVPAIRNEAELRLEGGRSPVCRHIGLYAYRRSALERFVGLPVGRFEALEGLEQLRLLEAGIAIRCIEVAANPAPVSGIDTPADLALAEAWLSAQ